MRNKNIAIILIMFTNFSAHAYLLPDVPSKTIVSESAEILSSDQDDACLKARKVAFEQVSAKCLDEGFNGKTIEESFEYPSIVENKNVKDLQDGNLWKCTGHVIGRCSTKTLAPKCELTISDYETRVFHTKRYIVSLEDSLQSGSHIGEFKTYNDAYEFMMKEKDKRGCVAR